MPIEALGDWLITCTDNASPQCKRIIKLTGMTRKAARETAEELGWHFEGRSMTLMPPVDSCPTCWPISRERWEKAMGLPAKTSP